MDEEGVPVAAIAAAAMAARALMRVEAGVEPEVVDALAVTAIRVAERFCGVRWSTWEAMPEPVRQGIAMLIRHLFEDREGARVPPVAVAALWRPYRIARLS